MADDPLEQALTAAKWGTAEADMLEVIARALQTTPALVARVIIAFECLPRKDHTLLDQHDVEALAEAAVPEDIKFALDKAVIRGRTRVTLRQAMAAGRPVRGDARFLVAKTDVCRGCPVSLGCALDRRSTPADCIADEVYAFTIERLEEARALVRSTHPAGQWWVPLDAMADWTHRPC